MEQGLNVDKVKQKAIDKGLITAEQAREMGASQLSALILKQIEAADNLAPGSTAKIKGLVFNVTRAYTKVIR